VKIAAQVSLLQKSSIQTAALRPVHHAVQGFARNDKCPYFSVFARRDDEATSTFLAFLREPQSIMISKENQEWDEWII